MLVDDVASYLSNEAHASQRTGRVYSTLQMSVIAANKLCARNLVSLSMYKEKRERKAAILNAVTLCGIYTDK